jgi:hypothetical protein
MKQTCWLVSAKLPCNVAPQLLHRNAHIVTLLQRLKQDGKIAQAIEVMNSEILQHFSADESSWEELAEL